MKPLYLIPLYLSVSLAVWWRSLPKIIGSSAWGVSESIDRIFKLVAGIAAIVALTATLALIDLLSG